MIREFLVWMATKVGQVGTDYPMSWSEALASSLNFWGMLEGTHVLSLMLFAGTIFIVDLRLLGLSFKSTPVSVISDRILPLTIFGLIIMIATGAGLFFAKPLLYYHNFWFRIKLVFLVIAAINIIIFHFRVQRNIAAWDTDAKPPRAARLSAMVSITSWILVITFGRFIAYDWFDCGKALPHWVNVAQECAISEKGALDIAEAAK